MFCSHELAESIIKDYDICSKCGSYYSRGWHEPKDLYLGNYWSHEYNRSTIDEQLFNVESKNQKIIEYATGGESVLEIACAPGSMLKLLTEKYEIVVGNDATDFYFNKIMEIAGDVKLISGFFPDSTKDYPDKCLDLIIGMDVLEHVLEGDKFLLETRRLLKDNGQLILSCPIILGDECVNLRMFYPIEHIWYYTEKWFREALDGLFMQVKFDRFIYGHEMVICQ